MLGSSHVELVFNCDICAVVSICFFISGTLIISLAWVNLVIVVDRVLVLCL